jgi:1,4-dihydroxy-2-naphthoyl-CoA hydrolase
MHDTDMMGILYFARQFRFAHDALEDFFASEGFSFDKLIHDFPFLFVIVHAEADYYKTLRLGEALEIHVSIEKIGNSSMTLLYDIFRKPNLEQVGRVKTVHVALDAATRVKCPVPDFVREQLLKHCKP